MQMAQQMQQMGGQLPPPGMPPGGMPPPGMMGGPPPPGMMGGPPPGMMGGPPPGMTGIRPHGGIFPPVMPQTQWMAPTGGMIPAQQMPQFVRMVPPPQRGFRMTPVTR